MNLGQMIGEMRLRLDGVPELPPRTKPAHLSDVKGEETAPRQADPKRDEPAPRVAEPETPGEAEAPRNKRIRHQGMSGKIEAVLREAGESLLVSEITDRLGIDDISENNVSSNIWHMKHLVRTGNRGQYRYALSAG